MFVRDNPIKYFDASGFQSEEEHKQVEPSIQVDQTGAVLKNENIEISKKYADDHKTINAEKTWLVENPTEYEDSIVEKLENGTEVKVLDSGKGERFNRTIDKYKWQKIRVKSGKSEGKEGWVMKNLTDKIEPNIKAISDEPLISAIADEESLLTASNNVEKKGGSYAGEYLKQNMKITPGGASEALISTGKSIPKFFEKSGLGRWEKRLQRKARSRSKADQLTAGLEGIPFAIAVLVVSAWAMAFDATTGIFHAMTGGLLLPNKEAKK